MATHLIRDLDHKHSLWPPGDCVYMAAATMSWPAFGTWLSRFRRKCTRHKQLNAAHLSVRRQLLPWNIRLIAAVSPRWASEITSLVPVRPRSYCRQKPSASLSPMATTTARDTTCMMRPWQMRLSSDLEIPLTPPSASTRATTLRVEIPPV